MTTEPSTTDPATIASADDAQLIKLVDRAIALDRAIDAVPDDQAKAPIKRFVAMVDRIEHTRARTDIGRGAKARLAKLVGLRSDGDLAQRLAASIVADLTVSR